MTMPTHPPPRSDDETLDDVVCSALFVELSRLVTEIGDRFEAGEMLAALCSIQAASSRSEDLAGWAQRLIIRQAQHTVSIDDPTRAVGAYL